MLSRATSCSATALVGAHVSLGWLNAVQNPAHEVARPILRPGKPTGFRVIRTESRVASNGASRNGMLSGAISCLATALVGAQVPLGRLVSHKTLLV